MTMSESSFDNVQIAYDFIEKAQRLTDDGKYVDAQKALEKAEQYAFNNSALINTIRDRSQAVRETRQQFIKKLETQLADIFNQERFDSTSARNLLHILYKEDPNNKLALSLKDELPTKEAAEQERLSIENFRKQLEKIWETALSFEEAGAGAKAVEEYESALNETLKMVGNSPNSALLEGLRRDAQKKRDKAKENWIGMPTLILDKKGKEFVARYNEKKDNGELYAEFFDENGDFVDKLPIDECIRLATDMASKFADSKAEEYLSQARLLIDESPRAAESKIKDALLLAYLSDFMVDSLNLEVQEKIQPAILRRDSATKKINDALKQTDVENAWFLLSEAEEIDAFAPGLEEARNKLIPILKENFFALLSSGKREAEFENFDYAERIFQDLIKNAQQYFNFGEEFDEFPELAQESYDEFIVFRNKIEALEKNLKGILELSETNPELAIEEITHLESQEANSNEISRIERCKNQVEFKLGAEQLFNSLEQKMLSLKDDVEIIPLEEMAKNAVNSYPTEEKFKFLVERINIRGVFLKGVRLRSDPTKRLEAKGLFEEVISRKGDDAFEAKSLIDEIVANEEQEADIEVAIRQAKTALANKDPRLAYMHLEPYRYFVTRQATKLRELISTSQTEWRNAIDQQLEDAIRDREISFPLVEHLIDELERCKSPRVDEWKTRALAPALASAAKDLQELGKFEGALEVWEEAFRLSPNNSMIVDGRRNAQKQRNLINAQLTSDILEKEQSLNDISNLYPDDISIKRILAEFYYSHEKYVEANMIVKQAAVLAKTKVASDYQDDIEAILNLESLLVEANTIEATKLTIYTMLAGNVSIESVWEAKKHYRMLLSEFPDHKEQLEAWWTEISNDNSQKLNEKLSNLLEQPGATWKRTELLIKMYILASENKIQQEINNLVSLTYQRHLPEQLSLVLENPTGKHFGTRMDALKKHIAKAHGLYSELKNISQFESISTQLNIEIPEEEIDIEEKQLLLENMLENLHVVMAKVTEIKSQIQVALATGEWDPIDDSLGNINELEFSNHRGVQNIKKEVESAKKMRQDADEIIQEIKSAFQLEDFQKVNSGLAKLKLSDPAGTMMLLESIEVADPFTGKSITGQSDISKAIKSKESILHRINSWLEKQSPVVEISDIEETIKNYSAEGDFERAIGLAKAVISEENLHVEYGFNKTQWSWGHARRVLKEKIVSDDEINSNKAERLLNEAKTKLQQLEENIQAFKLMATQLEKSETLFYEILNDLTPLIEKVNSSSLFDELFQNKELLKTRQQARELIAEGQKICPNYKLFEQILKNSSIKK